ncbi:MAG: sulfite exporter TauE/SafE family protein [Oceanicaulis sp.]
MTTAGFLIAVAFTAALSAMFGMAGGLVLMGVLAALYPVSAAMVTHGVVQSVSNGWRGALLRRWVIWRAVGLFVIGSVLAAGGLALVSVILPKAWLFVALGLVPFLVWLPKDRFALDARRTADGLAGGVLVTGLNVVAGVSGPLLDVFFQQVETDRRAIVATKAVCQVFSHAVKIANYAGPALSLAGGLEGGPPLWALALAVPVSILGTTLGARLLDQMSDANFRRWTKWIVTAIGLVYLARGIALLV